MKPEEFTQLQSPPPDLDAPLDICLRAALPEDATSAAELIYLPMGRLADYLFGFDHSAQAKALFRALFAQRENRFSHEFSDVLEIGQRLAGLLLAFPGTALKKTELPTAKQLRAFYGWRGMFRFLRRVRPLMRYQEAEPDEFYIFTLAIDPHFQRHGLGARLLAQAEIKARESGLERCSLGVTADNSSVIGTSEILLLILV